MAAADRGSPEWWRDRLLKKFQTDITDRILNAAYYDSVNASPEMLAQYSDAYRRLLRMAKTPWGRLAVDIVAERIAVNGFRVANATDNDEGVWETFRKNRMEAMQRQVHREALALGTSYVSAWPDEKLGTRYAYESAMAVTHETTAGDPHTVAAAIKVWHDSVGARIRLNVHTPGQITKYQSASEVTDEQWSTIGNWRTSTWQEIEVVDSGYDEVNIVPFVVRPTWEGYGVSDLEDLRPAIARIEALTANTLLAVELGAFRVRWATGLEIPKDPDTNEPLEAFKVAMDRLWVSADPDTKFGSFDATDIRPYLQAISDAIGQLSAVSRIPTLYFNQSELSNPPSAASLEAAETGLIKRVVERQDRFAESWEILAKMGLDSDDEITVSWDDPRTRSEAQMMDAAVKLQSLGVPFQGLLEFLGWNSEEVKRMVKLRKSDTFDRLLNTALPTATRIAPGGEPGQEQPAQAGAPPQAE